MWRSSSVAQLRLDEAQMWNTYGISLSLLLAYRSLLWWYEDLSKYSDVVQYYLSLLQSLSKVPILLVNLESSYPSLHTRQIRELDDPPILETHTHHATTHLNNPFHLRIPIACLLKPTHVLEQFGKTTVSQHLLATLGIRSASKTRVPSSTTTQSS